MFLNISCYIGAGQTSGESIKFPTILTDLNIKTTSFGRYLSRFFHQHSSILWHFSLWESCGSRIFKANKDHHRKMQLRIFFTQNFSESVTKYDRIYSARFNRKAFLVKAKTWHMGPKGSETPTTWIKCKFWKHIFPLL